MVGGQNIPEEFKKLFADILGEDGSTGSSSDRSPSSYQRRVGALDEEDY
jgi:hypothetical protein